MVMTAPGFIGRNGIGKPREGDGKPPTGVFRFNRAFGIADAPGCAIEYVRADGDPCRSGDTRQGHHHNERVTPKDPPDPNPGATGEP